MTFLVISVFYCDILDKLCIFLHYSHENFAIKLVFLGVFLRI